MARLVIASGLLAAACGQTERNEVGAPNPAGAAGNAAQGGTELAVGGTTSPSAGTSTTAGSGVATGGVATGGVATGGVAAGGIAAGGSTPVVSGGEGGAALAVGGEGGAAGAVDIDLSYAHWPMPNPPVVGLLNPFSYDTSVPGVVHDNVTGLTWQRAVPVQTFKQADAEQYCAALSLAGFSDWRVPSRIELVSLIDFMHESPSIDSDAFPGTPSAVFLTAAALDVPEAGVNSMREVSFDKGLTDWANPNTPANVRCVRWEHPVQNSTRYIMTTDTVLDPSTGLMWQRQIDLGPASFFTFFDGIAHCEQLTLEGYDDWHPPTMKEFQTLIDETRFNPAIDRGAFPSATSDAYLFWTGTIGSNDHAFGLLLALGNTQLLPQGLGERVECVRQAAR